MKHPYQLPISLAGLFIQLCQFLPSLPDLEMLDVFPPLMISPSPMTSHFNCIGRTQNFIVQPLSSSQAPQSYPTPAQLAPCGWWVGISSMTCFQENSWFHSHLAPHSQTYPSWALTISTSSTTIHSLAINLKAFLLFSPHTCATSPSSNCPFYLQDTSLIVTSSTASTSIIIF